LQLDLFRAVVVEAINENAAQFYLKYGFQRTKISPTKLILPVSTILASLEQAVASEAESQINA
jgi:hypothetical protein